MFGVGDHLGDPWSVEGEWLRGNLHVHSTGSDGRLTPQQVVDRYAQLGDTLLAISDHNVVTDIADLDARGMVLLPASEVTAPGGELGTSYHLLAIGAKEVPPPRTPASEAAAFLRDQGAVVFVGHPHWSGLTVGDILALSDTACGVEIHNGATVLDSCKGEALTHWDELLRRGAHLWGFAADDMHWGTIDLGLAWVHVRVRERTPEAVLAALSAGHFYASAGPQLLEVSLSDRTVFVRTTPCLGIYCLAFGPRNRLAFDRSSADRGGPLQPITEASFRLSGDECYIRIQAVDTQRRSAWSNPFYLQRGECS